MPEEVIKTTSGCDAMMGSLLGAMANKGSHTDPMAMAAMMNGNQWMNNPFIYLVFLMMFGNGGWFGNHNGNQVQDAEIQAKLNQLSTQMQDGNNTSLLMDAVKGNNVAIGQLASSLNCDFNQLQSAVCAVRSAIEQVGGQVGYSAEKVINAANLATITAQNQQDKCDILRSGEMNTQRIVDVLNQHWQSDLQQRYNDARLELSQQRQNAELIAALKTTTTTTTT